ncbi:TerD family protein [Spartinivicinus ruber]|uniref:TerD family protein n=1 Tax=Spartinivicinus ruber TaxID=2683272 RepID=UPI0013D4AB0F|nr:TerD family protein [Spartinivicinus ruber]
MAVTLQKGGNVSLEKTAPGMTNAVIGLGWDARSTDGSDFDLDASIFMVGEAGQVRSDADFIFYNQLKSQCGSVEHMGDNRTGEGEGDDESVKVDLVKIPTDIQKIVIGVTIHDAESRNQNFGQVSNAFIRIVNEANNEEVVRYDLSEDYSIETAMLFGELYRHGGEWKFRAVGQGFSGGLKAMATQYGVNVG